jgi:hypothetical protein
MRQITQGLAGGGTHPDHAGESHPSRSGVPPVGFLGGLGQESTPFGYLRPPSPASKADARCNINQGDGHCFSPMATTCQ